MWVATASETMASEDANVAPCAVPGWLSDANLLLPPSASVCCREERESGEPGAQILRTLVGALGEVVPAADPGLDAGPAAIGASEAQWPAAA